MSERMRRCPFCGGRATLQTFVKTRYACCVDCGAKGSAVEAPHRTTSPPFAEAARPAHERASDEEDARAVAAWNQRPS